MRAWSILKTTVREFFADKGLRLAAALSYYTLFSLAPFLLLIIGVVGLIFGAQTVQHAVITQAGSLLGADAAQSISTILTAAQQHKTGILATIIGIVTLVLGATGLVGQLKDALNTVWNVTPKKKGFLTLIRERLLSFAAVIGVAFLLLVSLALSAVLAAVSTWGSQYVPLPPIVLEIASYLLSLVIFTLLFAASFKYLPDKILEWRTVWVGAFVTAVLFAIGKELIGFYLGNSALASSFGAAAGVIALLVWVYYSAAIFFFGAEFTQVYSRFARKK